MSSIEPVIPQTHTPHLRRSLSARLLVLTIGFVMLAELFIWTPSVANYRKSYLEDMIVQAHLATLAMGAMPDAADPGVADLLLENTDTYGIIIKQNDQRLLIGNPAMLSDLDKTYDLRDDRLLGWIFDAFETLGQTDNRVLRIIGESPKAPGQQIEIIIDETPMRQALYAFSNRIFQLSLIISLFTAGLVFLSLHLIVIRPMGRITSSMARFREMPEDEGRELPATDRPDEIGIAQRELARMQREVRGALRQKDRLATLGAAVAKVNHDLRNSLATAMLIGDSIAASEDPEVKRMVPRLFKAMDRAVTLCSQTLNYVSDEAPHLDRQTVTLADVLGQARDHTLGKDEEGAADEDGVAPAFPAGNVTWTIDVPADIKIDGDALQLCRVFENLARNAYQAGASDVRFQAVQKGGEVALSVIDDGPGMADKAQKGLFKPFAGSARDGGTGLGLVIVRDIVAAHGGDIGLETTGPGGTIFSLTLPALAHSPSGLGE